MKTTLELAQQVSAEGFAPVLLHPEVQRLCELVRADEREACAKVCETEWSTLGQMESSSVFAGAIRARGQS